MGKGKQLENKIKGVIRANKKKIAFASITLLCILVLVIGWLYHANKEKQNASITPELARAMAYPEVVEGEEAVEGTDYVKFDAFFLRDINSDGYAESIRGTSKEIGSEDTLYMELNVQTQGYLKDAKITINGENFYLQTALPKDDELKDNYVGNNIKEIAFNTINNGTQKLITGIVRSGDYSYDSRKADAIGNNINNYSKVNSVTLTGTYVGETGEVAIHKTVDFTVDWYGTATTKLYTINQNKDNLSDRIDKDKGIVTLDFTAIAQEEEQELLLKSNHLEATIPELNGYAPTAVTVTNSNATFQYDAQNKKLVINKEAQVGEDGTLIRTLSNRNDYTIQVEYPIAAYETLGGDTITLTVPVKTYYEAYNNQGSEFTNPYTSNTAEGNVISNYSNPQGTVAIFHVTVGELRYSPTERYLVSKEKPLKLYNGVSDEETDDSYQVTWQAYTGSDGASSGLTIKENKNGENGAGDKFIKTDGSTVNLDNISKNVGIAFLAADNILQPDGWIKVYDDETGDLLATFTKENWNNYSSSNPYRYETPVKHVRIETSSTMADRFMYIYHIKELDDQAIVDNYTREEFETLQYIRSTVTGYIGGYYVNTDVHQANYETPYSNAEITISKNTMSTQLTEKDVNIIIQAEYNANNNGIGWINGSFLVKLPPEILEVEIQNINIGNSQVVLTNYEIVEKDGAKCIKIDTQNTNQNEQGYNIVINLNITPDPRIATTTKPIELYAVNEKTGDYSNKKEDSYDVNNNLNTEELVGYATTDISMVAPSSLLTNQIGNNYDAKGSQVISPQVADIKPNYAQVDQEENTAQVGIQVKNNYASTISEIKILGKIPFEGNTYVLSGEDLGSTFTTKMQNTGIILPPEVQGKATVYYSENENPNQNISDSTNKWKTADHVENWDSIKTFLIDLGGYVMPQGQQLIFTYTIQIPKGLAFNQIAYSHHGIYFSLDTDQGKYKTQTEPNKLGFRIAEKYNLELTKYQLGKENVVLGATYRITEKGQEEGKLATTNAQGVLTFNNLYAEKTYQIQEIKSPNDYEQNEDIIEFVGNVDENGTLTIQKLQGTTKEEMQVIKQEGEDYKVTLKVEDKVKAKLAIQKQEQTAETPIARVQYNLQGKGMLEGGRVLTTSQEGTINLSGIYVGEEYTLQETRAEGYYLPDPITFKLENTGTNFEIKILKGNVKTATVTEENGIPNINLVLENEKKPTYDLQIVKIKETTNSNLVENPDEVQPGETETTYLAGAKFKLYKEERLIGEYTTNKEGTFTITGLYQYVEGKDQEPAVYTLKEAMAPEGYAKVKDITFRIQEKDGTLQMTFLDGTEEHSYTVENNKVTLTLEDSPSFKLTKTDAETGETLSGIKFAIYDITEEEKPAQNSKGEILGEKQTINGTEYNVLTTNENGEITADLTEGLYKAIELEAPAQYDLTNNTYYFGIGKAQEGRTEVEVIETKTIEKKYDTISITPTNDGGYLVGCKAPTEEIDLGNGIILDDRSNVWMIKYNADGQAEWAQAIGEKYSAFTETLIRTSDEGYLVGGSTNSNTIDLGNGIIVNNPDYSMYGSAFIAKYNSEGKAIWGKLFGHMKSTASGVTIVKEKKDGGYFVAGSVEGYSYIDMNYGIIEFNEIGEVIFEKNISPNIYNGYIHDIVETNDGGYLISADPTYLRDNVTIDLENGITIDMKSSDASIIVKYNENWETEWAKIVGNGQNESAIIECIIETRDNGYLLGGYFDSETLTLEDGTVIENPGKDYDDEAILIKYSSKGELEWVQTISGENSENIETIIEKEDKQYFIIGTSNSSVIDFNQQEMITKNSEMEFFTMLLQENEIAPEISEVAELTIANQTKEFNITTEVQDLFSTKGGSISGEDMLSYEEVSYGETSQKPILMTPDAGYEIISITVNGEEHPFTANSDGTYQMPAFTNMTEDKHVVVTYALKENKIILQKVDAKDQTPLEGASFRVEQLEAEEPIVVEITTNSKGEAITQLPFGKYKVTELHAPEGYQALEEPIEINFTSGGQNTFTIENQQYAKVVVHHYRKDTTEKVAEDEVLEGKIDEKYTTAPNLDLPKYELIKDENGSYILPENATGKYVSGTIEVTYYYEEKQIPLTVHHYIEGTETKVPLQGGGVAEDVVTSGKENEPYETNPVKESSLSKDYELVEMPANATGTFTGNEIIVTYYYKQVKRSFTLQKQGEDGVNLAGVTFTIRNDQTNETKEYVTDQNGKIELELVAGDYTITETKTIEGYDLPTNPVTNITIEKEKLSYEITLENTKTQGNVIVHHYIQGTEEKVPAKEGGMVEDETKTGTVGEMYATKESDKIQPNYKFVETKGDTSGLIKEGTTEVYYYYQLQEPEIVEPSISKKSTVDKVTETNQAIDYTITYHATIKDYIGTAEVTIIDTLPFAIDKDASKLAGGEYNETNKTITWKEKVENINTYQEETKDIAITKTITLVYQEVDGAKKTLVNKAIGTILLTTPEKEVTVETNKEIPTEYKITIEVTKVWDDAGNSNQKRPDSIQLVLTGNGQTYGKTLTKANENPENTNEWKETFTDLPKFDASGKEIVYSLSEKETTPDSLYFYKGTVVGTTITNTFTVPNDTISLTVNKVWNDTEEQAITRPQEITFKVWDEEGTKVGEHTINTRQDTGYTFTNLRKYNSKGQEIHYTVTEQMDSIFYTASVGEVTGEDEKTVTITNTFVRPEDMVSLTVNKEWKDTAKQAKQRPQEITFTVWNEKGEKVAEHTLDTSKETSYTFNRLAKYNENGQEVLYTVTEQMDSIFYEHNTGAITGTDKKEVTITNTFVRPEDMVSITVNKKWQDTVEQAKLRPQTVEFVVLGEKGKQIANHTLNTSQETSYTFTNLPKYNENGEQILYVVKENMNSKFYTQSIGKLTGEDQKEILVTNTFVRPKDKVSITVTKTWEDQDNKYQRRPDAIKVQIWNGDVLEVEDFAMEKDDWVVTFDNLPKYDENGQEIVYQVKEEEAYTNDLYNYTVNIGNLVNITENQKECTITNTMTKVPGMVEVLYLDKYTGKEISTTIEKEGIVGESFDVTEDKKEIPGYTLVEEPKDKTGIFAEELQQKIYYYAKNSKVIVKYLEKETGEVVAKQEEILGYEGKIYHAEQKQIPDYTFVESTENVAGIMSRDTIEVIYYYAKNTKVIVKYLEKDDTEENLEDNKVLAQPDIIEGYEGKEYQTTAKEIPDYTFIECIGNRKGTMTEDTIEIIYYYSQDSMVIIQYLEKDNTPENTEDNTVLAKQEIIPGHEGKEYTTNKKDIPNYTFVESTDNVKGTMGKEPIIVIYYYLQNTKATVQHIDRETGTILKQETKEGVVGDIFQTHAEDFEGYVLVQSPEKPNVPMEKEEIILKYYYAHISAGVIEKHIDVVTGEVLDSKAHTGNEGDLYDIPAKTFEGYDVVEEKLPINSKGNMTKERIEVKYYYIKKAQVRVEYTDKQTGEKLVPDVIIEGHENDSYETEQKQFENYSLEKIPSNWKGNMTITKNEDGSYQTEIVVTYYYTKKSGGVIEKHIDMTSGKELAKEEHKGNVGDSYHIPAREFSGYELIKEKLPNNSKGTMQEKEIEVIYYYVKLSKVTVEYIDKDTGEKLDQEEIKGHEKDPYETEEKEFDGYTLVEVPKNATGNMTDKDIIVQYYYRKKATVEVQYLEKTSGNILAEAETLQGYIGDNYETQAKEIAYYNLVEQTENTKGKMTKDKITVIYYYEKQNFNLAVDKWVSKVSLDGITQTAKSLDTKDEIYKIDIHRTKTETSQIKVTYKIRITNKGEIEGTVEKLTEIIPLGYHLNPEDNKLTWQENKGILVTEDLKEEAIAPGKYKEIEIVLRWDGGGDNIGMKDNIVTLSKTNNPAGYQDSNKEDDTSKAQMMIAIASGLDSRDRIIVIGIVEVVIAITIGMLVSYRKENKKKTV